MQYLSIVVFAVFAAFAALKAGSSPPTVASAFMPLWPAVASHAR